MMKPSKINKHYYNEGMKTERIMNPSNRPNPTLNKTRETLSPILNPKPHTPNPKPLNPKP